MDLLELNILRRLIERSVRKVILDLEAERRYNLRNFPAATDDEIVEFIYSTLHTSVYNTRQQMERRFYAGITDDMLGALRHHHITEFLCCCRVGDFAQASRMLNFLGTQLGIHTGETPDETLHPELLADHTILYIAQRTATGFID